MTVRERLTNSQLLILRSIFKRSGGRPVSLDAPWQREFVPSLSRRGLAEIWYRQSMGDDLALRGPFADAAAYADARKKYSVARDKSLAAFCEDVVQVLVDMGAPGCQWLDLAKAA
jgi:hypothetical protein